MINQWRATSILEWLGSSRWSSEWPSFSVTISQLLPYTPANYGGRWDWPWIWIWKCQDCPHAISLLEPQSCEYPNNICLTPYPWTVKLDRWHMSLPIRPWPRKIVCVNIELIVLRWKVCHDLRAGAIVFLTVLRIPDIQNHFAHVRNSSLSGLERLFP